MTFKEIIKFYRVARATGLTITQSRFYVQHQIRQSINAENLNKSYDLSHFKIIH